MPLAQLGAGWRPLLEREIAAFQPSVRDPGEFFARAARYLDRLVEWNARIDLTAARDAEELVDLVFADAAAIAGGGFLVAGERWVDVGTGMGAPGVALALLEPELAVTLVEPRAKRVAFLRTLPAHVGELPIEVLRKRSEELERKHWTVAISRATLAPADWLEVGGELATRDVWVLLAREAAPVHASFTPVAELAFEWPLTGRARRAVCYRSGVVQNFS